VLAPPAAVEAPAGAEEEPAGGAAPPVADAFALAWKFTLSQVRLITSDSDAYKVGIKGLFGSCIDGEYHSLCAVVGLGTEEPEGGGRVGDGNLPLRGSSSVEPSGRDGLEARVNTELWGSLTFTGLGEGGLGYRLETGWLLGKLLGEIKRLRTWFLAMKLKVTESPSLTVMLLGVKVRP
jgi:hypothetical protein